ncbi:N-acetylmuramoyl-L-alanine amidase [Caproiciproducens sp. CPB-2]|uniref:N-acetylmuramoyl-L-alanine amidase n=1 Tax=Caproiciproducens sp. CPB-2 TaxID=3030017 RepID=UPI0023DBA800|nr:N-acetylmuramoyl-L-alanine amidase [Caproiciproducens sp. CPB-2]MDF1495869.1 N-acetylmuramoyl-L-alanine amidase [Caproiciproducens sp. CPB-2]
MNLHKLLLTNNACYKAGRTITPRGIMVHSTGADNPNLKRYVGPDDGLLGKNQYNNHWNTDKPGGRQVCVHAFIGKLANGMIATYQTLPWNMRGWHCGSGSQGSGNDTHISFEICEDNLSDAAYFNAVYKEAAELCAYLCKQYGIRPERPYLICHSEGHELGIASNHGDVMHWFPKHGKSMDTFRAEVKRLLENGGSGTSSSSTAKSVDEPAREVIRGDWGNGADRKNRLTAAGYDYAAVQARVNEILAGKSASTTATYEIYTVVKGDTLWGIAAKKLGSGTRYKEIKTLNGLSSDTICAGQKLKLPK